MKILTVVGARPQFIKAAAVSKAFQSNDSVDEIIVHTGQHYDEAMSDVFFKEMAIPTPKYRFDLGGMSHGKMTGRMIESIEEVCISEKPDFLMVYGDTNSTLAGALAAKKLHIKVAHVESGLRSFNMQMPEEINRILTDRISDVLFCPTNRAIENLSNEGITDTKEHRVVNTGDVMFDAFKLFKPFSKASKRYEKGFVLCTLHRAENTDEPERLKEIVRALNEVSQNINVVIPLHPRTAKMMIENQLKFSSNVQMIDPVSYFEMIGLLTNCGLVMTDSGGLQKEAYFAGKPCITLRDETEWIELVEIGANTLVGSDYEKIIEAVNSFQGLTFDRDINLYGTGNASFKILDTILGKSF
jgi:UDP-GlcNAc3NAcA epimerase